MQKSSMPKLIEQLNNRLLELELLPAKLDHVLSWILEELIKSTNFLNIVQTITGIEYNTDMSTKAGEHVWASFNSELTAKLGNILKMLKVLMSIGAGGFEAVKKLC